MVFERLLHHRLTVRHFSSLLTCEAMQTLQTPSGLALPALPARELFLNSELVAKACLFAARAECQARTRVRLGEQSSCEDSCLRPPIARSMSCCYKRCVHGLAQAPFLQDHVPSPFMSTVGDAGDGWNPGRWLSVVGWPAFWLSALSGSLLTCWASSKRAGHSGFCCC